MTHAPTDQKPLSPAEQAAGVTDPDAFWQQIVRTAAPGDTTEESAARGLRELRRRAAARAQGVAA